MYENKIKLDRTSKVSWKKSFCNMCIFRFVQCDSQFRLQPITPTNKFHIYARMVSIGPIRRIYGI